MIYYVTKHQSERTGKESVDVHARGRFHRYHYRHAARFVRGYAGYQ